MTFNKSLILHQDPSADTSSRYTLHTVARPPIFYWRAAARLQPQYTIVHNKHVYISISYITGSTIQNLLWRFIQNSESFHSVHVTDTRADCGCPSKQPARKMSVCRISNLKEPTVKYYTSYQHNRYFILPEGL